MTNRIVLIGIAGLTILGISGALLAPKDNNSRSVLVSVPLNLPQDVRAISLLNVGDELGCSRDTLAHTLEAQFGRNGSALELDLWGRRCRNRIHISDCAAINVNSYSPTSFSGTKPSISSAAELGIADIVIASHPPVLFVSGKGKSFKIPFEKYSASNRIVIPNYNIVAFAKTLADKFISVVILDLSQEKILFELQVPHDIECDNLWYVLDEKNEGLLCIDTRLKWMGVVDLKSIQSSK